MSNYPLLDRDLSWLSYNYRVLLEAMDRSVPTLERLRFIAIYSFNLDGFFRVRVADIRSLSLINKQKLHQKAGIDPARKLKAIHVEIERQLVEYEKTLREILKALELKNLYIITDPALLDENQRDEVSYYFKTEVLGLLRPYIFSKNPKKPVLDNQQLYYALKLGREEEVHYAYVNIPPSTRISRFYSFKDGKKYKYIFIDDIIKHNLQHIFKGYEILECKQFKFDKDAELHIDEEFSGVLLEKIRKQIEKRNIGAPSRFLYDKYMSDELLNVFRGHFDLTSDDLFKGGAHHNHEDFFEICNVDIPGIEHPPLVPAAHAEIDDYDSVMEAVEEADQLLHFPYQSYDYVIRLFNEAAIDQEVTEIYVTFHRLASESMIAEALISAARNGKKVFVFMEVKSRFDQENNFIWAKKLKSAGAKLVYSTPEKKVHAKIALIKKKIDRKQIMRLGFCCTGNFTQNSAKLYVDYGLMTVDDDLTFELETLFKYIIKKKEPKKPFEQLAVSQFNAVSLFKELVDKEIEFAKQGIEAKIIIKVNNLEDTEMIEKLYEAAAAGVKVKIIARSICSLVPDLNNIEVYRLVDRFLEHARVFYFFHEGSEYLLMGSSDWMKRNLRRRIEVTIPVYDQRLKRYMIENLNRQLEDNIKLVRLDKDLNNIRVESKEPFINSQSMTYQGLFKANS